MLTKLRSIVYHVDDLNAAKNWYADIFNMQPYFDEPFYVGFDINGSELGLDPDGSAYPGGFNNISYWKVDDIHASFTALKSKGVKINQEITDVGGGMLLGSIADPFGNVIGLIQD
ncbi:VOC family protein [Mucilaginibacter arboris]|uniref:VOC family protein n=1 Tax=Mucilaginibacter arboris TaxID=2682090 RepID=A0A7K1T060_9SPHI|nr:VOC family protein [Mucilaginibacter arboris]MVN22680.1 VOC family protein [Mucilaginibacter arboris]